MMSMSRKALILMALMLAAATAATAATAFAGPLNKRPPVEKQVIDAIQASSDAVRYTRNKTLVVVRPSRNGATVMMPRR